MLHALGTETPKNLSQRTTGGRVHLAGSKSGHPCSCWDLWSCMSWRIQPSIMAANQIAISSLNKWQQVDFKLMQVVCLVSTCTPPMAGPTGQNSQLVARLRSAMKLPSPSSAQRQYLVHLWSVCARVLNSQCLRHNNFCRLMANLCKIVSKGASKGSTLSWVCRGTTGLKWLARLPCHAMSTSAKSVLQCLP